MAKPKQTWLVSVGSGEDPLPDKWIEAHPELLEKWPTGRRDASGIETNDRLIYYAAHHQKLIAVARAVDDGAKAAGSIRVQIYLAIPFVPFAPHYSVIGKDPEAIEGMKTRALTDAEYEAGVAAFLERAQLSE
jgi:hypothetical protein